MGSNSEANELSVQELETLLLIKRRHLAEQMVERLTDAEMDISNSAEQAEQAPGKSKPVPSPELWRGAFGHDRYFRTVQIRPLGPSAKQASAVHQQDNNSIKANSWRRYGLLLIEIAALATFLVVMTRSYLDMRELNRSMAELLTLPTSEVLPSPTVTLALVLGPTATAEGALSGALPTSAPVVMPSPTTAMVTEQPTATTTVERTIPVLPASRPGTEEGTTKPDEETKVEPTAQAPLNVTPRLEIESIGVAAPIVPGDSWENLKTGIGVHAESVQPGQVGNLILSAHNDVYGEIFRDLDRVKPGDIAIIYTDEEMFRYRVRQIEIVEPTRVDVLNQTEQPILTMITCYPYLLDTHRVVVVADLIE